MSTENCVDFLISHNEIKKMAELSHLYNGFFRRYKKDNIYKLDLYIDIPELENKNINIISADTAEKWDEYQSKFFKIFNDYEGQVELVPK